MIESGRGDVYLTRSFEATGPGPARSKTLSLSRSYHFDFAHPVDRLWAVVADTPRWGEASGLPKYRASEVLQPDGSVKVFGRIEIAGFSLEWEEPPANWIEPRWLEQTRLFGRGPLRRMTNSATLTMSADFSRDPALQKTLQRYTVRNDEVELKGFFTPLEVCRISPSENT